jgi:hypothetical protein
MVAYFDKKIDRVRTILAGTPLSAESIRLSEQSLGSKWHGTSWFFLMHIIAKTFSRAELIPFNALHTTVRDYGISGWMAAPSLRSQLDKLIEIFNRRGLGNIHLEPNNDLKIDGTVSSQELRDYADLQYEYAMGEGLVRYSPGYHAWVERDMSNFAERIWWHYMTMVYDSPKIYSSPSGESALAALFEDMKEKMTSKELSFHNVKVWKESQLQHGIALLEGWERDLIERNILAPFEFGDIEFIAPRYFAEPDGRPLTSGGSFAGENFELMINLIENLRRLPGYPVYKGNKSEYNIARRLERAGAVTIVQESETSLNVPNFVYLVSRDVFENTEKRIKFSYSSLPMAEYGDISVTDQIFLTLGRGRAFAQKKIHEAQVSQVDYKTEIGKVFDHLETNGEATLENYTDIFSPLNGCLSIICIKDDKATVNPEFEFIMKLLCDFWNELINDPAVADIYYPAAETILRSEKGQVQSQIKKSLKTYFKR